jgi:hypothetical protein
MTSTDKCLMRGRLILYRNQRPARARLIGEKIRRWAGGECRDPNRRQAGHSCDHLIDPAEPVVRQQKYPESPEGAREDTPHMSVVIPAQGIRHFARRQQAGCYMMRKEDPVPQVDDEWQAYSHPTYESTQGRIADNWTTRRIIGLGHLYRPPHSWATVADLARRTC